MEHIKTALDARIQELERALAEKEAARLELGDNINVIFGALTEAKRIRQFVHAQETSPPPTE